MVAHIGAWAVGILLRNLIDRLLGTLSRYLSLHRKSSDCILEFTQTSREQQLIENANIYPRDIWPIVRGKDLYARRPPAHCTTTHLRMCIVTDEWINLNLVLRPAVM